MAAPGFQVHESKWKTKFFCKIEVLTLPFSDHHFKRFWDIYNTVVHDVFFDLFALRSRNTELLEKHGS